MHIPPYLDAFGDIKIDWDIIGHILLGHVDNGSPDKSSELECYAPLPTQKSPLPMGRGRASKMVVAKMENATHVYGVEAQKWRGEPFARCRSMCNLISL